MLCVADGLQMSRRTLVIFSSSLDAASWRALGPCAAAAPLGVDLPTPSSSSCLSRSQAEAAAPISRITSTIARAAPSPISRARPGFCASVDWMRPSRYLAACSQAMACCGMDGFRLSSRL